MKILVSVKDEKCSYLNKLYILKSLPFEWARIKSILPVCFLQIYMKKDGEAEARKLIIFWGKIPS